MKSVRNKLAALLASLVILGLTVVTACAEGNEGGHLINGSFELDNSGQQITITKDLGYDNYKHNTIKAWNTTATDEYIELFKENTSTYITGVTIKPTEGKIAAELNAKQESTLYQVVETEPLSLYEWGLDHGSRSASDTMALIIGPKQDYDPQKKDGVKENQDQFMQMVYWLKENNSSFNSFTNGIANGGSPITLYSAKFGEKGTFLNLSRGQSPFSTTRDDTYSEAWSIWVMTDACATSSSINPWTSYGKNQDGFESFPEEEKAKYRYIVPSGQTDTYFAFVSVPKQGSNATYGNFLDNCSFDLYRVFTGNTTPHGSAQVSGGTGDKSYSMSIDGKHVQYVANGAELTIEAYVPVTDPLTVSFAGVYLKTKDGTEFIRNDCADQGTSHRWTSEEKEVEEPDGEKKKVIVYTYRPPESEKILVGSAISMYFVFVKSPDITYDANGGRLQEGDVNLYSFKPDATTNSITYIAPYTAHAAVGPANSYQADTDKSSWRFMGWKLTDDDGEYNISNDQPLLPGEHTVVCNYVNKDNTVSKQPFVVLEGEQDLGDGIVTETGVTWTVPEGSNKLYEKEASGLTMIAQWTWRQAFAPMTLTETKSGRKYVLSDAGGTVRADKNENTQIDATSSATAKISQWYFGAEDETIEAEAKAKTGYAFEGWYDLDGQLIGKDPVITVTVRQREANSYYARFSLNYQQTFKREVKDGDTWKELTATDPRLSSYGQQATFGTTVSSNVAADTSDYRFIGWYTSDGNPVDRTMLRNNGRTIMYQVTGNAEYIARFEPRQNETWMLYYDANSTEASGITPAQEIANGSTVTVQGNGFTREYYTFQEWNTSADGSGTNYQPGKAYNNTASAESVTLYAQWAEITKYKLTYDANGGTGSMNEQIWYVGKNVTVQENGFTHDGYTFMGWNTKANGGGTAYQPGKPYTMPEGGGTLYAQWIKNVKVTYDPNGGEGTAHTEHGYAGEQFTVKTAEALNFIRENHTFVGWNTKKDGTGDGMYTVGKTFKMSDKDLVLYAQWAPNVKVTYHPNGGDGTTHSEFGYQGKEFTVKTAEALGFSREHYTFDGWKTEAGVEYKAGMNRPMPGTDLDLYAQWRENEKVWLRYDANGGTGSMPGRQAHSGEQVCLDKNAFTFINSRFMGWNTQPDGTGTAYAEGDWITLQKEDVTVYAQWEVVRVDLPQTGDSSHPALWLTLLSASSAALACLLLRRAKRA